MKRVGGLDLYHHDSIREGWHWPCPIVAPIACEDCHWLEVRPGGTAYCVAVEKLRQILEGKDDGSDLYELRERMRGLK